MSLGDAVKWNDQGLCPAVAIDENTGQFLMMAWMNAEALVQTQKTGRAHFYSRSRQAQWMKGESSGNTLAVSELRLDCDGDTILLKVNQRGGIACHTGRAHCFHRQLTEQRWHAVEPVLKDPDDIYPGKS